MIHDSEQKGFTLLEALLVAALIGLVGGLAVPLARSFQVTNDVTVAQTGIIQQLRRAQVLAQGIAQDRVWGVKIETGRSTLFTGTSFASRDATSDEQVIFPASIVPSGLTEVTFAKLTGVPQPTGTTTLTTADGQTRTITINSQGTVSF